MVNPISYALGGPSPVDQLFEGVGLGVGLRERQQGMDLNAAANARAEDANLRAQAQEARTAELHPLNVQGAQLGLQSAELGIQQQRQQLAQADRQLARQEAFQAAMGRLAGLGVNATVEDYQQVLAAFPEFGKSIAETMGTLDAVRQRGVSTRLLQIATALKAGATDTAVALAQEYADAARNSGDEASAVTAEAMIAAIQQSPEAGLAALGLTLGAIDPAMAGRIFGEGRRVQSSQIIEGRVAVQQMTDGSVRVVDTATGQVLEGADAADAIRAAEQAGIDEQSGRAGAREEATLEARAGGAESAKAAESLGAQRGQIIKDTGTTISNVTNSLRNYDRAIAAIDSGASAGMLAKRLPDITAASAELTNALNGLGLDVIGSVTFGALSEGELALAMDVAAPRNLGPEELRVWLIERREAQRKLRESLLEMQVFLSDPNNTLNDWYNEVKKADEAANIDFVREMQAKMQRGESLTPGEIDRLKRIGGQ